MQNERKARQRAKATGVHRSDSEVAEEVAGVYLLNFFFCFGSKEKEKEKMLIKKKKMAVSGRKGKEGRNNYQIR